MKIAIIIERANIALGGAERSVFELVGALSEPGHEVTILAAKGQTASAGTRILCRHLRGKRTGYFAFAKALKKYLAQNHFDIVHTVLPFDFADVYQPRGGTFAESILRNAASYENKFLAAYKRATAFANFRRTTLLWAERKLCRAPDGPLVAALSKYVAAQFKRHYGLDDKRIALIPNAVKTDKHPDPDAAQKLRSQICAQLALPQTGHHLFFLFVANNFRLKGLAGLIKAMQRAAAHSPGRPSYLIVAGGDRAHNYRRLAKAVGIDKRIVFIGPLRHIQNALSIVDIAVLPTFYDPSSRFILEAIAAGKPVITTRFNGATDLFVSDRHGKVIDSPEDVAALASAIDYFTDPKNIQSASAAILEDALKEKISISRVADQLQSLYERIIEKRKQP